MTFRLITVFILFACNVFAQEVSYGVKAGLNLADIVLNDIVDPDSEADYKMKPGLLSGVFVDLQLDDTWDLSAELLYSVKGVKAVGTSINLHYIALPILLKYSASDNFKIEAGPEIGYLFLAKSKYGNVNDVYNNNLDIGLDGGVEYTAGNFLFGLRFNAGFSSVIQSRGQQSTTNIKYQNRVLQFSIGYRLGKISL